MKKLVSMFLAMTLVFGVLGTTAFADDKPRTVTMFTQRHSDTPVSNTNDLWFIKHLEDKFNIKLEIIDAADSDAISQQVSLMFNTGDIPDLVWSGLSNTDCMMYGVDQGLILDWSPYLNENDMPNAYKAMQDYPDAFAASTAPDGKIYSMPYIRGPVFDNNTGAFTGTIRTYINKNWLEACGLEIPTSMEGLLETLRTFKEKDPMGVGAENIIPCIETQDKVKDLIWNALGFYGANGGQQYGTIFAIKNEQVVLPCYTEEAKAFLEFFNTMYTEGLISEDYFTMKQDEARGKYVEGVAGFIGDSTLTNFPDEQKFEWEAVAPLSSAYNDTRVASTNFGYSIGSYASANTKNLDLVLAITDYLYSDLGATLYTTGPMMGDDSVDDYGYDRWYYDEELQNITKDIVKRHEYTDLTNGVATFYYIGGRFDNTANYRFEMLGMESNIPKGTLTDKITGASITCDYTKNLDPTNPNDYWRYVQSEACKDFCTFIRLPAVYLEVDKLAEISDKQVQIENYVKEQSAQFITGRRSLDEFDAYQEELKNLGVEEYIETYREAYTNYMEGVFGK